MTRNTGFISRGFRCAGVLAALFAGDRGPALHWRHPWLAGSRRWEGNGEVDMAYQPPPKTVGLRIVPDNDVLLVDLNKEVQKPFKVVLFQSTGVQEDVTAQATITPTIRRSGR